MNQVTLSSYFIKEVTVHFFLPGSFAQKFDHCAFNVKITILFEQDFLVFEATFVYFWYQKNIEAEFFAQSHCLTQMRFSFFFRRRRDI